MRKGRRTAFWKAIGALSLVVATALVGTTLERNRQGTRGPRAAQEAPSPQAGAQLAPAAQGSPQTITAAPPAGERIPRHPLPRTVARTPQASGNPIRLPEEMHSLGPAPETVAPSSEVALGISRSPPAAVSAPRPAPAISSALVPAPEPVAAARPAAGGQAPAEPSRNPEPAPMAITQPLGHVWSRENVRAIRFDAGYYYGTGRSAKDLAEALAASWAQQGVNLVNFYAYNKVYGARYQTQYPGNVMEDYGRQDLLGHVLRAAHRRGIKVVAWFYGPQHKQMWDAHPDWREKTADGRDYRPDADSYYLCVRNPEVMRWWLGFLEDLLTHYPDLDGIDVAEAQVDTWGDHACFCEHCRAQFADSYPGQRPASTTWRQFRADGMTRLLTATTRLTHRHGKEAHVTATLTAKRDGHLMDPNDVRDATGFDLAALMASPDRPDVVQAELIWQQWAAVYADRKTFTPDWTREAVRDAKTLVGGRAKLIAHVELTDFGSGGLDASSMRTTIAAAVEGAPYGIDVYDAHLLEKTEGAARLLQLAWLSFP